MFPLNVFVPLHVLLLVVPNASENVLSDVRSPPPRSGYVVDIVRVVATNPVVLSVLPDHDSPVPAVMRVDGVS